MARSCFFRNSRRPAPTAVRAGGDSWGQVAPPKHVSETKNKAPQENHGKDYAEGEGKRALRHHGSLCPAFQGTGLSLMLYDLLSVAFWTSPLPPGHQGLVAAGCV